jgi:large subunit ribosomal protein L32
MRHTKSHTAKRRSHHALKKARMATCQKCGEFKLPHRVCQNCGTYKQRVVLDVMKRLTKKQKKQKEKELAGQEERKQKELSMEELSKK